MPNSPVHAINRSGLLWVFGQAGLVLLGVFIYFRIRGLTATAPEVAVEHSHDIVVLEKRLGIYVEDTLQAPVTASDSLATFANWIYIWGHWPVIVATMIWLAWFHRDGFRRLRDAMMVSGALGMAIFVSYPVAPPRLAGLGFVDTVTEQSVAYRVLQPPAFVNQYAAMPSLHSGWDLLVGMAIVAAASTVWLRVIGFAMPALMAFSVVVTANHYILDVVAGVTLVLIGHLVALRLERRRHRLRRTREAAAAGPGNERSTEVNALAIAHRAGNSLAGLHTANTLGVDVIECDVHQHRGRLEVRHLKTAGPLPFMWDRWELASASTPRLGLAELLAADEHGTTFMLDLKGRRTSAARTIAKVLHEGGHHRPILVCGRYWPSVDALAELPYVRPVLSARNRVELARLQKRLAAPAGGTSVYGVSVHRSLLDTATVAALQEHVDLVMTWPVNDIDALDEVLDLRVTGVISDEDSVLAELIRRQQHDNIETPAGP